jgi:hypothetical protein
MQRVRLHRRTFLRGVLAGSAISVGLPTLEAMLNANGEALADGAPIPTRFGVWFWGNGVRREHWVPPTAGTGDAWALSSELAPLAGVKSHLSVVTGATILTGDHPHHAGMTGVMTGHPLFRIGAIRDTIISSFAAPSVDVLAASYHAGSTPLRSLEVGITRFRGTDEGTTFQHLSHNGPNSPNPAEYSAPRLFARLFGGPVGRELDAARQSVLDAVGDQVTSLQYRVGAADRIRLEQHLDSIRALETRLNSEPGLCSVPSMPSDIPDIEGREQIEPHNRNMSDLIALAMSCDLTRVFSVQFSTAGSGVIVWQAGARNSLHQTCHDEALPQPTVHAATVFTMEQLAYLLGRLRDTPEGAGSLLDHSSILCTSELTDGYTHGVDDFPLIIAGRGGGRLRGNVHYQSTTRESVTRTVLTAVRGAGIPMASFGAEAGATTDSVGALES